MFPALKEVKEVLLDYCWIEKLDNSTPHPYPPPFVVLSLSCFFQFVYLSVFYIWGWGGAGNGEYYSEIKIPVWRQKDMSSNSDSSFN